MPLTVNLTGAITQVVMVILAIIVLVLTHELGHFIAAKLTGIRATEFFIGFGPRIWSFRRGGTEYGIKWGLVGGYVKILGMNPEEEVKPEDWPYSYRGSPIWKRFLVIFSGSMVHFLLALLVIFIAIWALGIPNWEKATTTVGVVGEFMMDGETPTPSSQAGLKNGDRIVSVDGEEVRDWVELRQYIVDHPGKRIVLDVEREGEIIPLETTLATTEEGTGYLGISPRPYMDKFGFLGSIKQSFVWLGKATYGVFYSFYRLVTPSVWKQLLGISEPNLERPVTVVGATRLAGQAAQEGAFYLINFFAFIMLFLAYINLLPLPPLDGGYLLVLLVEKTAGKEVDLRKLYPIAVTVLVFFGLLFLLTLRLDITNPINLP